MAKYRQSLEDWIQEALTDEEKPGVCSMVSLVHMKGDVQGPDLDNIHITSAKPWLPSDLSKRLMGKARSYAQDLPGVQTFMALAFYGPNPTEPQAFFPFMINGVTDFGGLGTEGPNGQGLVQQSMRHSEAVIQLSFRQSGMLFEQMQEMNRMLSDHLKEARTENIEAWRIVKEVGMQMVAAEKKQQLDTLTFERESDERRTLLKLAPPLINKITGQEIIPQSTVDSSMLELLAEKMTIEDIEILSTRLSPEVWGIIGGRMTEILEAKKSEQERTKRLIAKIDPEKEAAGEITTTDIVRSA